ncbi:MAG TPA: beta-mannosidase [Actinophytocola sp.]|uniref:glycosyl hydrolase 2 galactose-binding domain-containing protein n=1 Tax=Actinophytocola sp. TaxID=1872138 RepID=UPI002DFFE9DD|nr:beta-mannosidase [Actinophytocola sp.]
MRQFAIVASLVLATLPVSGAGAEPAGTPAGELVQGWRIQSSAVVRDAGARVSQPGYSTAGWLPISQPETLMAGLLENGRFPDVFRSDNLARVPADQFTVNWWYRNEVTLHPRPGRHSFLVMNGVLSRANLWVNGTKIADQGQLQGAYSRFEYDLTPHLRDGANAIALDMFRNDTSENKGFLTLDMVDWNPDSPDNWTGLQFAPALEQDGAISVRNAHVVQRNAADLSSSELTVKADLRNNTGAAVTTTVSGEISRPGTLLPFSTRVTMPAGTTRTVTLPALRLAHPAVWWPYQMGDQPMYHLAVRADAGGTRSDEQAEDFGIRTVTSHLTPVVPGRTLAPDGYRQFVINGQPLVIRGGGWSQELFLRYSPKNIHDQLSYVRNLGLNTIRLEGNFPPDDMLRQMDRMGVLAMPGWQCCDKWEQDSSRWNAQIKASAANQAANVARWFRDHPSVFCFFQGSDNEPDPDKEKIFLDAFRAADWALPQIASAEYKASAQLGQAGAKEGPYNYSPPSYWWNNGPEMNLGGDFTNAGGAFGYDTETGNGNTIPTPDSLNRFLTPAEQGQLWDVSSTNGKGTGPDIYHTSPFDDYTAVGRLGRYNTPLWNRYGHWSDLASYQRIAQAGGYEVTRAQFEAYLGHAKDPANPSTGLIYWQLNKAWPSLQWELYGFDLDQPGVYFGAQKAGEPVHVMYAYDDGSIKVANLTRQRQTGLRVAAEFVDLNGTTRATHRADVPALSSQDVATVLRPAVPTGISPTYFLKLTLTAGDRVVSRNVYWLSTKPDVVDFARTLGEGSGTEFAPNGYADLTGLQTLAPAQIQVTASSAPSGEDMITTVTVRNVSSRPTVGFQLRADVRRGTTAGSPLPGDNQVLPILWSENNLTLWPGETQTITARYAVTDLHGATPVVSLTGWNSAPQTVSAR